MRAAIPLSIALIASLATNAMTLHRAFSDAEVPAAQPELAVRRDAPRDRAFTSDETKTALLASVTECHPSREQDSPYWRNAWTAERLQARLRDAECREHVMARVAQLLGPAGARDPLFHELFNPIPELAFLSPRDQYAAERHGLEIQLKAAHEPPARPKHANATNPSAPPPQPLAASLGEFLDPATVLEVLLRYSPLADSIRAADVARSEDEFRFVFAQLQGLERAGGTPRTYLDVRRSLEGRLGRERYRRLWAARDPAFAAITKSVAELGRTEATGTSVYEIVNDTQDLLAAALLRNEADPTRAQSDIRAAIEAQTTRLAGLLGEEGARRITAVLATSAVEMADPAQYARAGDLAGN